MHLSLSAAHIFLTKRATHSVQMPWVIPRHRGTGRPTGLPEESFQREHHAHSTALTRLTICREGDDMGCGRLVPPEGTFKPGMLCLHNLASAANGARAVPSGGRRTRTVTIGALFVTKQASR